MKRYIKYIWVLLFFIVSFQVRASMQENFKLGNDYYNSGEFEKAISAYSEITDSGFFAAELYYNMGNAYFRTNNIAHAILYYEKALKLNPRDKETIHNLEIARARTIDKMEVVPEALIISFLKRIRVSFSIDAWGYLSLGFFVLALSLFFVFIYSRKILFRKITFYCSILVVIISVSMFLMGISQYFEFSNSPEAIIIEPSVSVKSEPGVLGAELYILHEGTKVEIIKAQEDWVEIILSDGNTGWMQYHMLEKI